MNKIIDKTLIPVDQIAIWSTQIRILSGILFHFDKILEIY